MLPWQQNFWITTIGSFCNGDGEQLEKAIGLDWQKNKLAHASPFLYISYSLHDCDMKLLNLCACFMEHNRRAHHKNVRLFIFLNLDTVLLDLTQKILPTFDKFNEIK